MTFRTTLRNKNTVAIILWWRNFMSILKELHVKKGYSITLFTPSPPPYIVRGSNFGILSIFTIFVELKTCKNRFNNFMKTKILISFSCFFYSFKSTDLFTMLVENRKRRYNTIFLPSRVCKIPSSRSSPSILST